MYESEGALWIRRTWSRDLELPEDFDLNASRLAQLDQFGKRLFPQVKISIQKHEVSIQQRFIRRFHPISSKPEISTVLSLSEAVRRLRVCGLIHGDLCFSNVGINGTGNVCVFDWEPFLRVRTPAGIQLRSSKYACHQADVRSGHLTYLSDRYALANLVPQILKGRRLGLKIAKEHGVEIKQIAELHSDPRLMSRELLKMFNFQ